MNDAAIISIFSISCSTCTISLTFWLRWLLLGGVVDRLRWGLLEPAEKIDLEYSSIYRLNYWKFIVIVHHHFLGVNVCAFLSLLDKFGS